MYGTVDCSTKYEPSMLTSTAVSQVFSKNHNKNKNNKNNNNNNF